MLKSADVRRIFGDGKYDSFRNQLLDKCKTDAQRCPFCEEPYDELAEFVDVGVGMVQVTPNYCSNEECGASETGQYELDKNLYDFKDGWHRPKDWSMLPGEETMPKGNFAGDEDKPPKLKATLDIFEDDVDDFFRLLEVDDDEPKETYNGPAER